MPNILLVDDEKAIRKTLREILEYEKYKVDEAEDGPSALEKIQSNQYDIVLLDIKMPKMDGLEVLEKAREVSPDTSYIMISGHGNIETAVEATKKGAFDFITLDLHLPGKNGIAWLREFRAAGYTTPLVIISGSTESEANLVYGALGSGAQEHM